MSILLTQKSVCAQVVDCACDCDQSYSDLTVTVIVISLRSVSSCITCDITCETLSARIELIKYYTPYTIDGCTMAARIRTQLRPVVVWRLADTSVAAAGGTTGH